MDTIHKRVRVNFVCTDRRRPPISSAVAQRHWQAQPSQAKGSWTLAQANRTHPQLSPGSSLRMVAAFRPVPPACDSISNRKATFRRRRSFTTRSASPSQRGTTHQGIVCQAPASWRCKQGCTATRSARCTGNWKTMEWWKPWPARASMCATSKNLGKSGRHRTSAIAASRI